MNVDSSMCASSGEAAHWQQISWLQCERQVRRLQARIVKATREGRWGKVNFAAAADPLVFRQSLGCETGRRKIKAGERREWTA